MVAKTLMEPNQNKEPQKKSNLQWLAKRQIFMVLEHKMPTTMHANKRDQRLEHLEVGVLIDQAQFYL